MVAVQGLKLVEDPVFSGEIGNWENQKNVDLLSNFNPAYRGIEISVSASGFQSDNTPRFGKKCKLVNEECHKGILTNGK